ncbi:MAG: helix-turn-helix domain-containing protein [Ruminococcaceae bacterium]|nr:helix-turn-helix domain-containing protein [Oscillospiraceae bacterium]
MDKNPGISCAFYTVKQLASLFGKSEDTIRRWKNEGVGREDDNIKLRAVEREDGFGRKNSRHLVFSRDAVIEFVKANPFLMDDAPQLGLMMQAEGAWNGGAIPLGGSVADDDTMDEFSRFSEEWGPFESAVPDFEDRRPRAERPQHFPPIPPFPEDDSDDDFEDGFDDFFRSATPPRPPRRSRAEKAKEEAEKLEMLSYIKNLLERELRQQRGELRELSAAIREMNRSDVGASAGSTLRKVLFAKNDELRKNIRYLEEFLEILAEEED